MFDEDYFLKIPVPGGEKKMIRVDAARLTPEVLNELFTKGRDKLGRAVNGYSAKGTEALIRHVVDVSGLLAKLDDVGGQINDSLSMAENGHIVADAVMGHIFNLRKVFTRLGDAQPSLAEDEFNDVMYGLMSGLASLLDHLSLAETTADCHKEEARFFEETAQQAGEVFVRDAKEMADASRQFLESVADILAIETELKACADILRREADDRRTQLRAESPEFSDMTAACEAFSQTYAIGQEIVGDAGVAEESLRQTTAVIESAQQRFATVLAEYDHVRTCTQSRTRELQIRFDQVFPQLKARRDAFHQWCVRLDRGDVNAQALPTERGLIAKEDFKQSIELIAHRSWTSFRVNERVRMLFADCHADPGKDLSLPPALLTAIKWARASCEEVSKRLGLKPKKRAGKKKPDQSDLLSAAAPSPEAAPVVSPALAKTVPSPLIRISGQEGQVNGKTAFVPTSVDHTSKPGVQLIKAGMSRVQRARSAYELLKCVGFVWTASRDIRVIAQVRPMFAALLELGYLSERDAILRSDVEKIILGKTEAVLIAPPQEHIVQPALAEVTVPWVALAFREYGGLTYKLSDLGAEQARAKIRELGLEIGAIDRLRPASRFKESKKS